MSLDPTYLTLLTVPFSYLKKHPRPPPRYREDDTVSTPIRVQTTAGSATDSPPPAAPSSTHSPISSLHLLQHMTLRSIKTMLHRLLRLPHLRA
ncbi:hypothetical protein H310_14497 [Aphanomyces invadans]|uniref:Uncharacterized protein n=1 Tax=Aphanomyces invadans TaxID=157072 RepID=A0A024T9T0_9STRA|nr:hypothetical protein H310_14497 [Aphanomyces invadans]ETV90759.1 hypothetical protein H310_14497 [Aphanomyces invadans]|eukprot:XP_008880595.1 hypothetical protein H310_14497 [Aphanomyces invadans]